VKHWYSYHSEKTMGHTYASAGGSGTYLSRTPTKLDAGDIVWVIEGDIRTPTRFSLVDCFAYSDAEFPPFVPLYSRFAIRILGHHSLLRSPVPLNRADRWFFALHGRFITKQKFFSCLEEEPELVEGLCTVSAVKFLPSVSLDQPAIRSSDRSSY
jgi:hypothetical protein